MVGSDDRHLWRQGMKVEVSSNEEGLTGAWFEAIIVRPQWKSPKSKKTNKALIQYQTLVTDDTEADNGSKMPLKEYIHERFIRPIPVEETREFFELNEVVDAYYLDAWWTGVITEVLPSSKYTVTFQNPPDKLDFDCSSLRLHLDWINGKWVRPEKLEVIATAEYPEQLGPSCNNTNDPMEANQHQSSGSGTAKDKTGERTLSTTNSGKNQIEQITPCNQKFSCAGISTNKKFKPAAPSSDATISRPLKRQKKGDTTGKNGREKIDTTQQEVGVGNQTIVSIKTKGGPRNLHIKRSPTSVAGMKIKAGRDNDQQSVGKECIMKEAKMSAVVGIKSNKTNESQGKNAGRLPSEEIDQHKKRGTTSRKKRRGRPPLKLLVGSQKASVTDAVGKDCTSDGIQLPTSTTTYVNLTGCQDASIGKIAGETDCSRETAKLAVAKISYDVTGDHQPLRMCSEGIYSSTKLDDSRFSSGGTKAGESKVELPRIDCTDNNLPPLNQKLPFAKSSPIWEVIESMEVFQTMQQNPHFHPLYNFKEECREGLAISSMVTFANLVAMTGKLQLDNPRSIWVSYLEVLDDLEMHGFDVKVLRDRLNELLAIKDKQERNLNELEKHVIRLLEDVKKNQKIDEKIDKLNKKLREFEEKRASVVSIKEIQDTEIATLQLRVDDMREGIRSTQLDFERGSSPAPLCLYVIPWNVEYAVTKDMLGYHAFVTV